MAARTPAPWLDCSVLQTRLRTSVAAPCRFRLQSAVLYAPPPFQSLPIAPRCRLQPVLVPPTTTAADFNLTTRAASDRLMSLHGEIDWISEGIALACLCLFWSCDPSLCHAPPQSPLAASELHIPLSSMEPTTDQHSAV